MRLSSSLGKERAAIEEESKIESFTEAWQKKKVHTSYKLKWAREGI